MLHTACGLDIIYLCLWICVAVGVGVGVGVGVVVRLNVTLLVLWSIFLSTSPSCNGHLFNFVWRSCYVASV